MALAPGPMHADTLERVEDELLLLLKDAKALLESLKQLPSRQQDAQRLASSILAHLAAAQEGIFANINWYVDYLPYERSATSNRLKARQAQADVAALCSALEITDDALDNDPSSDEELFVPGERSAKRVRYET